MKQKNQIILITSLSLILSACSKEKEPVVNTPPTIIVQSDDATVEEGKSKLITASFSDEQSELSQLKVVVSEPKYGKVARVEKGFLYTAGWLTSDKIALDTFTVTVTDESGESAKQNITISVSDLNEPLMIEYQPIQSAEGKIARIVKQYENMNIDLYVEESQSNVSIPIKIIETDSDDVQIEKQGGNFITQEDIVLRSDGDIMYAIINVPAINSPSETDSITLSLRDNDITIVSLINIKIGNTVQFDWDVAVGSNQVSEREGGLIGFKTSESNDYPIQYSATIKNTDGTIPDFEFPQPIVNGELKQIIFNPSMIMGNKSLILELELDDGESVMTYSLPIFIIDDINQEFDSLLNVYQDHVRFYD
ncbi:MAG: hypothetical protein HAW67_04230, partial [Endozoicomonadaceae bacterium]|nr:hypothetical protein [Endozoicomonadaceae bacterium]